MRRDAAINTKSEDICAEPAAKAMTRQNQKRSQDQDGDAATQGRQKRHRGDPESPTTNGRGVLGCAYQFMAGIAGTTRTALYRSLMEGAKQKEARMQAQEFIDTLMTADFEPIPDSGGMTYLRDILNLETGRRGPLIVRTMTNDFWDTCIDLVNMPGRNCRVVAVGTPGIGKTASTSILIRKLLKAGHTVVYLIRTASGMSWFYQFTAKGGEYVAEVFPEAGGWDSVPSLESRYTYYIVDPGDTTDSCYPPPTLNPKFILVTAPNSDHWGGSALHRCTDIVRGIRRYYPIWTKEELDAARPIMAPGLSDALYGQRFLMFGGVPARTFGTMDAAADALIRQDTALRDLADRESWCMKTRELHAAMDHFQGGAPKDTLMGISLLPKGKDKFDNPFSILLSRNIEEKLYAKHPGIPYQFVLLSRSFAPSMPEPLTDAVACVEIIDI
jgi:hypothetical protein